MGTAIEPTEILENRWADQTERAAEDLLLGGGNHAEISWAIACVPGGAYTLTRRAGCALSLTLPGALCELLGMKAGDRVVYEVTERGTVEVRRANLEDLPKRARLAALRADYLQDQITADELLKRYENRCLDCGETYTARSAGQQFCPACRLTRHRESNLRCWHRRGKQSPSYQARLGKCTLVPTGASS